MKRLMTVLIVVVIVAGLVTVFVWRGLIEINIYPKGADVTAATEPNKPTAEPNEPNKPAEPNEPNEPEKPTEPNEPNQPAEPNEPNEPPEPNDPMESLSLKEVEVKDLLSKIREWTGKSIIPVGDALKQKITIYTGEKIPRSQALRLIFRALREKGYVAEEEDGLLLLRPMADTKIRRVPTISDSVPLASLENKDQIVQKFFKLKNYSPSLLQQVLQPMMPEYGHVYTVESTNHLVVIDTVSNLFRVRDIIEQLDVPEAEQTVTKTFIIKDGDPVEIVQLLNILLSDGSIGTSSGSRNRNRSRRDRDRDRRRKSSSNDNDSVGSVVISAGKGPVTLIPISKRKWIIAKASAESIDQIGIWIEKLDEKKPDERGYSLRPVIHAEVADLADYINDMIQRMPLRANVMVQALVKERKIMIVGSAENREMVEQMIADIDVPSEKFKTEDIPLRYADPEEVKKNIDDLYGESDSRSYSGRYYNYSYTRSRTRGPDDPDMVKVYAFPILKQVTVMCSEENMKLIKDQIKKWDRPINIDDVLPYIIEVKNSDPVKMADLLTRLFTETTRQTSWWDRYMGNSQASKTIVGPLYGQRSFEAVPDTKKIIVQSKIPEGYEVAKKLVEMLDKQEMAEVPRVVTLNYADPEDLSERLNAIFCEPGTVAPIRLRKARLSKEGMESTETGENQPNQGPETTATYTPPWSKGQRRPGEMPLSNMIGRIRFMPDWRSKSILVLAPEEFMDKIVEMIKDLDRYVNQLRIKAVVVEVSHKDMTSLGIQLRAGLPITFGPLDENALTAFTDLAFLEEHGSLTLSAGMTVSVLVDFLVKHLDAKVLNEQTLWTKDNEEADIFNGQTVPFIDTASFSNTSGRDLQNLDYKEIGMTLRILPNITPQKNVDMNIDLTISRLTSETVNGQPVVSYINTTTTAIVGDGQTIMLGAQTSIEDSVVQSKIPFFGDLPLIGPLFRHTKSVESNTELLIFITPEVIGPEEMPTETSTAENKLKTLIKQLQDSLNLNNEG